MHEIPQTLLLCPECEYRSLHQSSFLSHLVQSHGCRISEVHDLDIYRVTVKEEVPLIRTENKSDMSQLRKYLNANGEYCCPRCDYSYETINLLKAHCREGHGPHTWYICPCCPFENRSLHGIRAHLSTKHKKSASIWESNLEGRKIDKRRFPFFGHISPPIRYKNCGNKMIFDKNESLVKTESFNSMPFVSYNTSNKSKSNIDCITIPDD